VGTQRKPSPLLSHCSGGVNLSGICWESGGNLLSPVVFMGWFIPRLVVRTFGYAHLVALCGTILPPPHEDALMIKLFLVWLCGSVWRWAHPPYLLVSPSFSVCFTKLELGSKTNLKYAFSHANMRMFRNFSLQVVTTSGFVHYQGSANNKTEATSKIIKVPFLRTSIEL